MKIAILKNGLVINVIDADLEIAQEFLSNGVFSDVEADNIIELPDGFGIDDSYIGGEWVKKLQPEPEFEPEQEVKPVLTLEEKVAQLEERLSRQETYNSDIYAKLADGGHISVDAIPEAVRQDIAVKSKAKEGG